MWNWKFAIVVTLLNIGAASAGAADPETPADVPQAPKGFFLVEEDAWDGLSDEPGRHMDHARQSYVAIDLPTAAGELRKAAAHLRITACQAAGVSRRTLIRSASELESLALRMEAGSVKSVRELDMAFARALHALAHHHHVMAEKAWMARETQRSGRQLRAAADNLSRAAAWSGRKAQAATGEVIKDTRIISGKLVEGTGFVIDEVGKGLRAFGRQVETVGTGIEPHALQDSDVSSPR